MSFTLRAQCHTDINVHLNLKFKSHVYQINRLAYHSKCHFFLELMSRNCDWNYETFKYLNSEKKQLTINYHAVFGLTYSQAFSGLKYFHATSGLKYCHATSGLMYYHATSGPLTIASLKYHNTNSGLKHHHATFDLLTIASLKYRHATPGLKHHHVISVF